MTALTALKVGPGSGVKSKMGHAKLLYSWKIRMANYPPCASALYPFWGISVQNWYASKIE